MDGSCSGPGTMADNVSELLTRAQLDNARDVYKLIESCSELNPCQDRELTAKTINKVADYHNDVVDKLIEEGKADQVAGWAADLTRLR